MRPGCQMRAGSSIRALVMMSALTLSQGYMSRYTCNSTESINTLAGVKDEDFFCKPYVNYTVACDADVDPSLGFNPSCNNSFAIQIYSNFERALSVYSCKDYSRIWTCDNCTVAYKRWMCSALYRKCNTVVSCPANFTRSNDKAIPECVMKTCQDVCYDVVRKCPVHLEFRCPPVTDLREYDVRSCNNLEKESTNNACRLAAQETGAWLGFLCVLVSVFVMLPHGF